MERTIQDILDKQKDSTFRFLSIEDLDCWAKVHDWLLVEVETHDEINILRHYLTPIGNEILFHLDGLDNATTNVIYSGMRRVIRWN